MYGGNAKTRPATTPGGPREDLFGSSLTRSEPKEI